MESFQSDRASLPRNMIENSMFEEEPDIVDLAKETPTYPLDPDDVVYEPRSSRLLVRGLGENDMDEDEEDYESSARLLGMSFMNRSSSLRPNATAYSRQEQPGSCLMPSPRTLVVGVFVLIVIASVAMVIYFLPKCTFTKEGCHKTNTTVEDVYPISSNGELFPWASQRLPGYIQPVHYELLIHPNLNTMTFQGNASIQVNVLNDTKKIVLHSSDLQFTRVTVQGKEVKILEYKPWQQIAITLTEDLKKGQMYNLTFEYMGNLSNGYSGFYNSSYTDKEGVKRVLAATQFEPVSARKAFPCFDEPAFKAIFSVRINREAEYISLSNMPKEQTLGLRNGLQQDVFEKSPRMSTYLVAFIVANFSQLNKSVEDTLVSVYAVPDKVDQLNHALDSATKLLEFYNKFLQLKYPLKKLDLVAIPDFLAGAMENWGLITFRETALLLHNQSSLIDKQSVTYVIAHELAHQWFGNLVTMKWWNDLWLNEGVATYMEYISVEKVFPELEVDNDFLRMRFRVLEEDSLNSSHPISTEVTTPEQVEEMFDSVSYEKGASILLMLNSSLSEEKLQSGFTEYLKKYQWSNTDSGDLWRSIPSDKYSVVEMMSTWTLQKGFPLVTVNKTDSRLLLSQEPFSLTTDAAAKPGKLWHIPLTYVNDSCSNSPTCKQMFYLKDTKATIDISSGVTWVKFNFRNDGFYIVHYDTQSWEALFTALNSSVEVLTPKDRASLINNIFLLSRLGKVSFKQVVNLLQYLDKETHTAPLMEALSQLDRIYRLLEKRSNLFLSSRMQTYIMNTFGKLMDRQSWQEEPFVSKQELRLTLLEIACRYYRENCTHSAMLIFNRWEASNQTERIPGDLRKVVFSVAAQEDLQWKTLLDTYARSVVDMDKRKLLMALASTPDVHKMVWLLKTTLEGSIIQTQDLPLVLRTVCTSFPGHLYAWDFVKENWEKITQMFPIGSFALQDIVMSTTYQFSTERRLFEVQSFFGSLKDKASEMRCVHEAVEMIKLNIQWMERNLATMGQWL